MTHQITLIPGDGIGPEVIGATKKIIDATGIKIDWDICEAGAAVFKKGLSTGLPNETIESLLKNKIALKGPLETPVGYGGKSANVTLRKMFETYGNIRPIFEIPGVKTPYSGRNLDIVIIRENVEDLYAGIEHMQTPSVAQCLKLITRKGCEKIARFSFEFARSTGRKKVSCATKANIMKLTEGLMKRTFEDVSTDYSDIETDHIIVDNCAHMMVKNPEMFDVIVTTNMNGDILSDLGSGLVGGLGLAPGANIGDNCAIFEAVHGSAPTVAGKNIANPTAVLLSGVMMLRHIKEFDAADAIQQALFVTIGEDKFLTCDLIDSKIAAKTTEFTDRIIENLGKTTKSFQKRKYTAIKLPTVSKDPNLVKAKNRQLNGIDIFIETEKEPSILGKHIEKIIENTPFSLKLITCRGIKIYPVGRLQPDLIDAQQCRFILKETANDITNEMILNLLNIIQKHYNWTHIEKLHQFDGKEAYSKAHGEN